MPPRKLKVISDEPPEIKITWREGSRPPKGVAALAVKAALDALPVPSPERLLEASKDRKHCLHAELWNEGDQVWAQRGRLERCRHIISDLAEVVVVGGRTIQIRAVEWLRNDPEEEDAARWVSIHEIVADRDLLRRYLAEVSRLQDQASAKLTRVHQLLGE